MVLTQIVTSCHNIHELIAISDPLSRASALGWVGCSLRNRFRFSSQEWFQGFRG